MSDPSSFMRYKLYLLENCNQLFDFYRERHGLLQFHQSQNKPRATAEAVNLFIDGGKKITSIDTRTQSEIESGGNNVKGRNYV